MGFAAGRAPEGPRKVGFVMTHRLTELLDSRRVKYTTISHSPAYSSQELAEKTHVHGWEIAKATLVKVDGKLVMAVLAAPDRVDIEKMRRCTNGKNVTIATEPDLTRVFPDCELGAIPPFGRLWGLPLYVDERLTRDESILFNAGTHTEAIRMSYQDFARIAEPMVANLHIDPPRVS